MPAENTWSNAHVIRAIANRSQGPQNHVPELPGYSLNEEESDDYERTEDANEGLGRMMWPNIETIAAARRKVTGDRQSAFEAPAQRAADAATKPQHLRLERGLGSGAAMPVAPVLVGRLPGGCGDVMPQSRRRPVSTLPASRPRLEVLRAASRAAPLRNTLPDKLGSMRHRPACGAPERDAPPRPAPAWHRRGNEPRSPEAATDTA